MPPIGPTSRRVLVRSLRRLGFQGPQAGGRHAYMWHPDGRRVWIPNPHTGALSTGLVLKILQEAGIDRGEWETV